jgi:hypothetical protein
VAISFIGGGTGAVGEFHYFITPTTLNYLAFQSFYFERHLMKVIPETRCAH